MCRRQPGYAALPAHGEKRRKRCRDRPMGVGGPAKPLRVIQHRGAGGNQCQQVHDLIAIMAPAIGGNLDQERNGVAGRLVNRPLVPDIAMQLPQGRLVLVGCGWRRCQRPQQRRNVIGGAIGMGEARSRDRVQPVQQRHLDGSVMAPRRRLGHSPAGRAIKSPSPCCRKSRDRAEFVTRA